MAIPDFGMHEVDFESGGYKSKLSCKYMAPGLTMQDIMKIFNEAEAELKPGDHLSGNPSKWPNHRGVTAVVNAVLKSIYG